ncbi:hypothetical protein C942_02717 [Photobacterium marinum]|uniref:Uncharacterized protein n=1 Tax=Photobacterium marinum TaxID=1056511 RepID=L8JIA0_9GAMM|nr:MULTISPECIES: hypothetical protein [Photobacterium]ELR67209.1 hypothetical protein C942_02717 [Photobacterium marinum]
MEEARSIEDFVSEQAEKLAEAEQSCKQYQAFVAQHKLDRLQAILEGQLTPQQRRQREIEQRQFMNQPEMATISSTTTQSTKLPRRIRGISV